MKKILLGVLLFLSLLVATSCNNIDKKTEETSSGSEESSSSITESTNDEEECELCKGNLLATPLTYPTLPQHVPTLFDVSTYTIEEETSVGDGVVLKKISFNLNNGNKSIVHLTEVDLKQAQIVAGTARNSTATAAVTNVYNQVISYEDSNPDQKVLVASNADFFGGNTPVNAFVKDGVIMKNAHNDNGLYDYKNLAADIPASMPFLFGISRNQAQIGAIIDGKTVQHTIQSKLAYALDIYLTNNNKNTLKNVVTNSTNPAATEINILSSTARSFTISSDRVLYTLEKHEETSKIFHGAIKEIQDLKEDITVKAKADTYYISIPKDRVIDGIEVGMLMNSYVSSEDGKWDYYSHIIGARQGLVLNGEICSTVTLENSNGAQRTNIPRTAIGIMPSGNVVLVTVEALRYNSKLPVEETDGYGLNLPELADFMRYYGVYNAGNFDGGGSTQLIVREGYNGSGEHKLVVRSSDYGTYNLTAARGVINSILICTKKNK